MRRTGNYRLPASLPQDSSLLSESVTYPEHRPERRTALSLALAPLALLGILCGCSLVQRTAAAMTHSNKVTNNDPFGKMTAGEARQSAISLCSELTDSQAVIQEITPQCAFSEKRKTLVREWSVLCDTSEGQYLVRINADTRRVYAVNRMDSSPDAPINSSRASRVSSPKREYSRVTRTLAEERALAYLRIVGIPSLGLKQIEFSSTPMQTARAENTVPQWNFTYSRSVPGLGERLLKVSVNGQTGGLEHVWNPVFAL